MIIFTSKWTVQWAILAVVALSLVPACSNGRDALPEHFTIGLITNNQNGLRNVQGFMDGMAEFGYVEGENVTYLYDEEPISADVLEAKIEAMVASDVDLIFTAGTPTGVAAHKVTAKRDIPVVFGVIADPIAAGVMTDLTQPGGNMTGVMLSANQARRLELLLLMAPDVERVLVPYDPTDAASSSAVDQISELAPDLGIEIVEIQATNDAEVTIFLENFPMDVDAVFLVPGTTVNARLSEIVEIVEKSRLPLSGPSTAQVEAGALMTYGFVHREAGSQAARVADQILKGTNPGQIPVEVADFFLAINLATAEEIGLAVPNDLLQQAQIIIRSDE